MIDFCDLLGIEEGAINNAYEQATDLLSKFCVDDDNLIDRIKDDLKYQLDINDITNSIISSTFTTALAIIREEYPDIDTENDFYMYVNCLDSHLDCKDEYLETIFRGFTEDDNIDRYYTPGYITPLRNSGILQEDLEDIIHDGHFHDVCQIFQNDNDITIYGDVLELGEDNPFDEECPDRYSEAEFGQYLCDQYEENGGDVFYYKCKDGSIIVGLMV